MAKIAEAQAILKALGLPSAQQNEISGYTLLALCDIEEGDPWRKASRRSVTVTKGILDWLSTSYGKKYAPNTRETFRRQALHQFVQAGLADYNPDNPALPTNSPRAHYAITEEALRAVRAYGGAKWKSAVRGFIAKVGTLTEKYHRERESNGIPLKLANGRDFTLSPGKHNEVQAAIVERFAPIFAAESILVYLGDTADKNLYKDEALIKQLGIELEHAKLPDVVLLDDKKCWVYLIEAVTSHGPMTPKRLLELREMFVESGMGLVFVSAFPDFVEFRKHMKDIAWETEVWLADTPEHMIHFNGDRFLGPR
jgi:type II restriction enzyme